MPPKTFKRRYRRKPKTVSKSTKKFVNFKIKTAIRKNIETKYHDVTISEAVSTVASIGSLTDVSQGQTDTTRIGDKLTIRGLSGRASMLGADASNLIRIIIFQWHHTDSVAPVIADILSSSGDPRSNFVHDTQNQYTVLYDKLFTLTSAGDKLVRAWIFRPRLKYAKKTINYSAGSTVGSNKIYRLFLSDSGASVHPSFNWSCRFYYDDA